MTTVVLLVLITGVVIFFVSPQLAKFRATLGINAALESEALTVLDKIGLMLLGLKTPFLNTLALIWSFILAEGNSLMGFSWEQIVSHEHAVWIACSLWFASLWAHFTGLNAAAASPPVISPLPGAVPPVPPAGTN
jgi:hypothetical protein